jgi:hypothetical protein
VSEGLEFFKSGQFQKLVIAKPNTSIVTALYPMASDTPRNDNTEIPISAWDSFQLLVYIVNCFLRVNTYPAFREPGARIQGEANTELMEVMAIPGSYDGTTLPDEDEGLLFGGMDIGEDHEVVPGGTVGQTWTAMSDAVFFAKPSPIPASANIGSPAECPNLPGLFFPYFHRLLQPDYTTIPKLIGDHFYRFLGGNMSEADQNYKDIQRSWGAIQNTDSGMVLAHVLFGIRLSLQTQTRLFLLQVQKEYMGFCLLGERFRIFDGTSFVEPMEADKLRNDIAQHASTHIASLGTILQLLRQKESVVPVPAGVEGVEGAQHLMKLIGSREFSEDEEKALSDLLAKLDFRKSFWTITNSTIIRAITLLTSEKATPLDDSVHPGYAGRDIKLYGKRAYRVLSMFGPTSFSFINRAGTSYRFPPMTEDDPLLAAGDREAGLLAIHVGIKPLAQAVADWEELVAKGEIRQNLGERAGKYRNCVFTGKSMIEVWTALRTFVRPDVPVAGSSSLSGKGKKRAVDDKDFDLDSFLDDVTKIPRLE